MNRTLASAKITGEVEVWYFPAGQSVALAAVLKAAKNRIGEGRNIALCPRPPFKGEESVCFGVERIDPAVCALPTGAFFI